MARECSCKNTFLPAVSSSVEMSLMLPLASMCFRVAAGNYAHEQRRQGGGSFEGCACTHGGDTLRAGIQ